MINKIENDICYASWVEGVTQSWDDVADIIHTAWLFGTFSYVNIYSVLCYVGSVDAMESFIYQLTNEWGHP